MARFNALLFAEISHECHLLTVFTGADIYFLLSL